MQLQIIKKQYIQMLGYNPDILVTGDQIVDSKLTPNEKQTIENIVVMSTEIGMINGIIMSIMAFILILLINWRYT